MTAVLLVVNAGSSSVKFQLFIDQDDLPLLAHGQVSDLGGAPFLELEQEEGKVKTSLPSNATHEDALKSILKWIEVHDGIKKLSAAGHRIAHGGKSFDRPVKVTQAVIQKLQELIPFAPLHQPHNIAAIDILARLQPDLPQVACFDTSFHVNLDPLFTTYALPKSLRDQGIHRYGFHGLSYEWIVQALRRDHSIYNQSRIVVAHLGNGSSLCAIQNGKSVDTTMGFTPLEGPPMGTRSGSIDPGIFIHMSRHLGFSPDKIEHCLYEESGLKGLSGMTSDVKLLLQSHDPRAHFALDHFTLKVAQHAAMMTASLQGIDALVFTGGIGENSATIRNKITERLKFLGTFPVLVIPANEERVIAQHTREILG